MRGKLDWGLPQSIVISCWFGLCCLPVPADAGEGWGLDSLMHSLATEKPAAICFKEQKSVGMLEVPIHLQGTFEFIPPDVLSKTVQDPFQERYEIHTDYFLRITPERGTERFSMDEFPLVRGFVASFRAALNGNRELLERYYRVSLGGNPAAWKMDLEPRDEQLRRFISAVELHGGNGQIRTIDTYETNGDHSRLRLGTGLCREAPADPL